MPLRFKHIVCSIAFFVLSVNLMAQGIKVSGTVLSKSTGEPVEFATVVLEASNQWAVADVNGKFTIGNVQPGKTVISVSSLGFVTDTREITITKDIPNYKVLLLDDNLTLENAVVTAQEKSNSATTSRTIDRTALDHVQVMNVSDIAGLLPGGSTSNPLLTSEQQFNIRGGSSEAGNASFGTAVEVDGVRLSNNASFAGASSSSTNLKGVTTNNIASSNIESVEIITGVPSVEYGDMTSGVVKINTKRGKTPFMVTMSMSPNTKQTSFSKGFSLGSSSKGASRGVLNTSMEYAQSVSNQMSPYTSYDRKQLSMTYSNTFSSGVLHSMPVRFSAGFTGNLGGLDNTADPDKLRDTYTITKDNTIRGNISANWLLSKPWITTLEFNASAAYSDKTSLENGLHDSAISTAVLHQTDRGYYMADLIPAGYWYNLMITEDKPLNAKVSLKATWARNFGKVNNKIKYGAEWAADKNLGVGLYSDDISTALTFREYRYCDVPLMSNAAAYFEDNLMIPVGADGRINLIAGLRNDNTIIKGSAYGTTSSISPRFNAKYTVFSPKSRRGKLLRELSFRGSWGVAVKQPSYSVLYPTPTYADINVFTSTASADNVAYRAFYVLPRTIEYNSALKWQSNRQSEIGVDFDLGGNKISLAGFYNKTDNAYRLVTDFENLSYSYTNVSSVQGISIPAENRVYTIDPSTGAINVSDKTGAMQGQQIAYTTRNQYQSKYTEDNDDNSILRYGLEWVVDFKRIKAINTTIRLDGTYYTYKSVYTDLRAYCPTTVSSYDGSPFKYVGYYIGGNNVSNGSISRNLRTNVTVTTNIPQVRMIVSAKIEASLMRYSRYLSESKDGERSKVLTDRSNILSTNGESIYAGENYTVLYPEYYTSYQNPGEQRNYMEDLVWAKANDAALYSDLAKLAQTSSYLYQFCEDRLSPYVSANFSVTKEIGNIASISFYVNNFFNNMSQLYSTRTKQYVSASGYIPSFYYGLTVRFTF